MYVAFVGSREYPNLDLVRRHVRALRAKYPDAIVVSGGCRGVDKAAELEAERCGLDVLSYRPAEINGRWGILTHRISAKFCTHKTEDDSPLTRWPITDTRSRGYGAPAFHRNGLIAHRADVVMAYPCEQSNGHLGGTGDTIKKAEGFGRPVHCYPERNPLK